MGPKPPLLLSPVNLLTAFLAELLTELAADPTVEVKFWRTPCTRTQTNTSENAASGTELSRCCIMHDAVAEYQYVMHAA